MQPSRFSYLLLAITLVLASCEALQPLRTSTSTSRSGTTGGATSGASSREVALRNSVVAEAKRHLGTRYKYAGREPRTGFDCSGFTRYALQTANVSLSASSRTQINDGRPKPITEVEPGDLVFFRRSKNSEIFHVALVISNDRNGLRVIHSTSSRGVVEENISQSTYWKPKLSEARDVLGS